MEELPLEFHSSLSTSLSRWHVAQLFSTAGWEVRKSEVALCPKGELYIESEILVHGIIADVETAERVVAIFEQAGIAFIAECYGPDGELLREWRTGMGPAK